MALSASTRSEGRKTRVGCAIEDHDGRIIATGYNGYAQGFNLDAVIKNNEESRPYYIHAETNALSLIQRGQGKVLYCTHSPCISCAQNIIAHKIQEIVYINLYEHVEQDVNFKSLFESYNIKYRNATVLEKNNILESYINKNL